MEKVVKIAVQGALNLPIDSLEPFQGDLKTLDKTNYEKLRKAIIEQGYSFTIHVWQNEGKNYIIDGHQRLFTLKQMRELEAWQIPDLPVSIVSAVSFQEAKRKVLSGASAFGVVTEKGLLEFIKENDIPFDEIVASCAFTDVDFQKFSEKYLKDTAAQTIPEPEALPQAQMQSSSGSVKQIQLFFNNETYEAFIQKVNELAPQYGKDNITDTVMEAVNETHRLKFPVA